MVERDRSVEILEQARAHAASTRRPQLALEIAGGIDIIKATAPIDVPLVVFVERESGEVDMGVITLSLPVETKNQA